MHKVLIAYTSDSGSTADIVQFIKDELCKDSYQVDMKQFKEVTSIEPYSFVIIAAPMIVGWHRAAKKFIRQFQQALSHVPVVYFFTMLNLTQTVDMNFNDIPIFIDPDLAKPPKNSRRLSIKERYATLANYLRPVLQSVPAVSPVHVAFFGGKLELFKLKLLPMLFVMLIIQAQPGDFRNWIAIQNWVVKLRNEFLNQ